DARASQLGKRPRDRHDVDLVRAPSASAPFDATGVDEEAHGLLEEKRSSRARLTKPLGQILRDLRVLSEKAVKEALDIDARQRLEKKRLDGSFLSSVVARVWREALEDRASVFAIVAGGCDHDEGGGVVAGSARRSRDGAQDIDRERLDRVEIVDEERDRAWRAQREERLRDAVRGDLLTHAGVDVRVAGLALDGLLDSAKESRARRIETKPREPTCPARDESRGRDFDAAAILAHEVATDLEPESKLAQEPRLPASRRSSNEENAGACARSSRVACSNDAVDELRGRPNEGRREPEREVRVDPCGRAEELDGGGVR